MARIGDNSAPFKYVWYNAYYWDFIKREETQEYIPHFPSNTKPIGRDSALVRPQVYNGFSESHRPRTVSPLSLYGFALAAIGSKNPANKSLLTWSNVSTSMNIFGRKQVQDVLDSKMFKTQCDS